MTSGFTLVLSGSGALYPAHLGAAQALWEAGCRWTRIVGTSGGAIVAAYLSSGKPPRTGLQLMKKVLPKNCMRFNWRFWQKGHWGLYSLKPLEKALAPYVPATFSKTQCQLYIVTTDLVAREAYIWSGEHTPKASVAAAIRMSASVPGLFAPEHLVRDGRELLLTDGGVVNNFAVDYLAGPAVGIRLLSQGSDRPRPVSSLRDMCSAVLSSMMRAIELEHIEDATFAKVVSIPVKWDSMDFWRVGPSQVEKFYETGYQSMKRALSGGKRWW